MKKCFLFMMLLTLSILSLGATQNADGKLTFQFQAFPELGEMGPKYGDCTIITFPNGKVMVLDTAIRSCEDFLVQHLQEMGIEHIDYVVISHMHSDHYGGMRQLLNNFTIGDFYWSGYVSTEEEWVPEMIERAGVPMHTLKAGDILEIGGVKIEVLWPSKEKLDSLPKLASDPAMLLLNNNSLLLRFDYKSKSALFTGDIYKTEELSIIKNVLPEKLDVDLIKIPHHGHDTSSSKELVAATSPEVAVMMGNIVMSKVIYYRYWKIGCTTYATWMNGTVKVTLDEEGISVSADNLEINDYYSFT